MLELILAVVFIFVIYKTGKELFWGIKTEKSNQKYGYYSGGSASGWSGDGGGSFGDGGSDCGDGGVGDGGGGDC